MLLYTLATGVKLAAAWGQDPTTASAGAPGLDVGTGIPPLPLFSAGKNGTLYIDNDGDGFVSPGDVLLYTIAINNISRAPVPDILLQGHPAGRYDLRRRTAPPSRTRPASRRRFPMTGSAPPSRWTAAATSSTRSPHCPSAAPTR